MNNDNLFNDFFNDDSDYCIPDEAACSAEFPGGCIICDEA